MYAKEKNLMRPKGFFRPKGFLAVPQNHAPRSAEGSHTRPTARPSHQKGLGSIIRLSPVIYGRGGTAFFDFFRVANLSCTSPSSVKWAKSCSPKCIHFAWLYQGGSTDLLPSSRDFPIAQSKLFTDNWLLITGYCSLLTRSTGVKTLG